MKVQWIMVGGLVVLPFLVYLNSLHNDFVYDDVPLIVHNPGIRGIHRLPSIFSFTHGGGAYRPVRMASYALDYSLNRHLWRHLEDWIGKYDGFEWGLNPFGYHFSNLIYHLTTVVLVFLVIAALANSTRVAFLAALMFSIHPVHTESVAYISGRRDLLSTLFYLLGFYSFIKYRTSAKWGYCALLVVCYVLAVGAKEMAVTLPLICFSYDGVCALQRRENKRQSTFFKTIFNVVKEVVARYRYFYLTSLMAASFVTYYKVWVSSPSQRHSLYGDSISLHVLTIAKVMVHYLKLMWYPITLVADYSYNGFPLASSLFEFSTFAAFLILVSLLYCLLRVLTSHPLFSFGVLWWCITLLPVSHIFPHHELMAEHYLYLPSVGFFLCAALVVAKLSERWRMTTYGCVGVVVMLFSIRTGYRNVDWKDSTTLWEHTVKAVPNCVRAQNNLGVWYYAQGRYHEAQERYLKALLLNPDYEDPHNNLGNVYLALGSYEEAKAQYTRTLQIDPSYEKAYCNLGMVCIKEGRYQEAQAYFKRAITLNPHFANPYYGMGVLSLFLKDSFERPQDVLRWAVVQFKRALWYDQNFAEAHSNLGSVYILLNRYEEAEQELLAAVKSNPDLLEAQKNLAELYVITGRSDEAIASYLKVQKLSPGSGEVHYHLGTLYRDKADYGNALAELREALRLQYDGAEVHHELGMVYSAQRNYAEAVSEYTKALSLSPAYVEALYNLALVYHRLGKGDEALRYYRRAIELKPDFSHALNNMGSIYARRGDYGEAARLFKKVIELDSSSALAHNNLGNVYREQGAYGEAIKEYELAARLDTSYSDPDFNLAQMYLTHLKETAKALYHYKKSIAIDPHHPRVAALTRVVEDLEKMVGTPPSPQVKE